MREADGVVRWGPLRWPPRVATSIEYGLAGAVLGRYYLQGVPPEVTALELAHGWMAYWGPDIGAALATLGFAWVLIDRFRQVLRRPSV